MKKLRLLLLLLLFPLLAVAAPVAGPAAAPAPVLDVTALAEPEPAAAAIVPAPVNVAADEAVVAALPEDPGRGFLVDPAVATGPPAEPNPVEAWRFFPPPVPFAAV